MSVIGIDFGNESCYIAAVRDGGLEIVTSDTGQRMIPSYISFGEKSRCFGSQAKSSHVTNVKNTIFNFKRLIGGSYNDPFIQNEKSYLSYPICESENRLCVKVSYQKDSMAFFVEQIVAMLLAKLKETAEAYLGTEVIGCVLSIPSYFPNGARQAMLDAAEIAKLNVLKLMNETAAVAMSYGFYKEDIPSGKPIIVVFVDIGHSAMQVSVCSVGREKVMMITTVTNGEVGGRDFDIAITRHFAKEFQSKYNLEVLSSSRAIIRLTNESEKLKKQLSANPQALPLNIECFMDDKDVQGTLGRTELETICADLLLKVEDTLKKVLVDAKLHPSDIKCVELVGGSTRIPAIKRLIQKLFCCEPRTTLNLDEAVARGCALQCAILSPHLKVRQYTITDRQLYPIKLVWKIAGTEEGELEVFPTGHQVPFSRYLTFFKTQDFTLEAMYGTSSEPSNPGSFISSCTIRNIMCSSSGESAKILIKIRVNVHGIFCVTSAMSLAKNTADVEPIDQKMENFLDVMGKIQGYNVPLRKETGVVELPIDSVLQGMTCQDLSKFAKEELNMTLMDKYEKERVDARNALEEYVYELRCSLTSELEPFVSKQVTEDIMQRLQKEENWLYEDGQDSKKETFAKLHSELKALADPLYFRKREYEQRFDAIDSFRDEINRVHSIVDRFRSGDPTLAHLNPMEMDRVRKMANQKSEWLDRQIVVLSEANLYETPPVLLKTILDEKAMLMTGVNPILYKRKSK